MIYPGISSDSPTVSTEQANQLLALQRDIMEKVALGHEHEYQTILDQLCKATELLIPDAAASIMVFDKTNSFLNVLSAPSLPAEAIQALNGLVPGSYAGSCGTAVYSNNPQFVFNTCTDLRWVDFKQFIMDFSVGACWAMPIRINKNSPIGSFALSSFEERKPSPFHIQLLETSASIAGIILKRQQEQKHLWRMAHYDALTGLPNRTLLTLHMEYSLEKAQQNHTKLALLFLDLDNFKEINDTQGHNVGDEVLKIVANKIANCLRPDDTFARLGGDEFVIIIDLLNKIEDLHFICKKILNSVKQCRHPSNFAISTSIGACVAPDHGDTIQLLFRNADTAMYEAKSRGSSNFSIYQEKLTADAQNRSQLIHEMDAALIQQQFCIHYQPQFDIQAKRILGVEALVRWQHHSKGLISPLDFIPLAEETGFIKKLGEYILKQACEQCLNWWAQGVPLFKLAVNVSVKQLYPGFGTQIKILLEDLNFPIDQLELEITESNMMQSNSLVEIENLNTLGLAIAMDDFGTGHSSLAQLKSLPISTLKIDRCFIKDIPDDKNDMTMTRTIIAMGHSLGMKIVAEGVETQDQLDFLRKENCDQIQGFLLSKPLSADELLTLLKQAK